MVQDMTAFPRLGDRVLVGVFSEGCQDLTRVCRNVTMFKFAKLRSFNL
jgi:hypothetical protein